MLGFRWRAQQTNSKAMELAGCFLLALLFADFAPGSAAKKVPAIFVFGDSTADVGNNNYLPGNEAKADYTYYGIDYPGGIPTGRFSNGYNGIDYLAKHMGFNKSPPAFFSLSSDILKLIVMVDEGLNFASGGSGILDSTGTEGSSINMTRQIEYFEALRTKLGKAEDAQRFLSKSIFLISAGGNDVFDFFRKNNSPNTTEEKKFISNLTSHYEGHLKKLYSLGARKFGLIDVAPIGCCPYSRALNPAVGACIPILNDLSLSFNKAIKECMSNLKSTLEGIKYSIGSTYAVISTIMDNPSRFGYTEVKKACCGAGKLNAETRCNPDTTYCTDRDQYLFWDMLHPSQKTAREVGMAFYIGSLTYASPINFKQLVEDDGLHSSEQFASKVAVS